MCESSECSGETERMLRLVQALPDRICHIYTRFVQVWEQSLLWRDYKHAKTRLRFHWKNMPYVCPFCACARAVKALTRLHICTGASENWLIEYAICSPILCMCESSEGSDKTACMLLLVWALAERICHMYAHLCACASAVKALVSSGVSEHSLIKYAICTPIMCMCESSESSGETARMLRLVWALNARICHIYTHFVHVREQCMLTGLHECYF